MNTKAVGEATKSLANRIRATGKSRKAVETPLRTDERVIARITDGIYRQPSSALRELISNAYDADAKKIVILTDAPRFSTITIRDDGIGLTPESLQHLIEHIGGSAKRTQEGAELEVTARDDPTSSPGGRQLIGKLGIGLFSVAQFTRHFLIITKTRGAPFRTIADITLGPVNQEIQLIASPEDGKPGIETGHARIWIEHAPDVDAQGTEITLLDLLPRTKAELASADQWAKLDFEREESGGKATTAEPKFHIGRTERQNPDKLLVQPRLPWSHEDPADERFRKFVQGVRGLAVSDQDNVDLDLACDRYLQTLWTLALSAPLDYLEEHPFDLDASGDLLFYKLDNQTRGQASPLLIKPGTTPRKILKLKSPALAAGDRFEVEIDGVRLKRPIVFRGQPKTRHAVKTPLLFVGRCREDFAKKPIELSGGALEFEAYLLWTPRVLPTQHQGVIIRVGNAAGALFDRTFMGYQVSEQTRLRQIIAEIFVLKGLDGAINIDRESFNYAHPHYQFIVKWLHSAIRQLTNKHKEVGKEKRKRKVEEGGKAARRKLEDLVLTNLAEHGVEDVPEVVLLSPADESKASSLRQDGTTALRRSAVVPESSQRQTSVEQQRSALFERKAVAIAQLLAGWGLLDDLSFADQERLVRDILQIATSDID